MRPRVFPAEDRINGVSVLVISIRFNEAAGIPRGRPIASSASKVSSRRFNEAAGIPRGRLGSAPRIVALMRTMLQ